MKDNSMWLWDILIFLGWWPPCYPLKMKWIITSDFCQAETVCVVKYFCQTPACCWGYTPSFLALSRLSPPQEGACKHHDTFVIIKSLHSLLREREGNKKREPVMTIPPRGKCSTLAYMSERLTALAGQRIWKNLFLNTNLDVSACAASTWPLSVSASQRPTCCTSMFPAIFVQSLSYVDQTRSHAHSHISSVFPLLPSSEAAHYRRLWTMPRPLWRWSPRLWHVDVIDSDCEVVGWRKQYRACRWRSTSVTSEHRRNKRGMERGEILGQLDVKRNKVGWGKKTKPEGWEIQSLCSEGG